MFNLLVILLSAVILLLVVQIAALLRVRSLIRQLKTILLAFNFGIQISGNQNHYPKNIKKCQFCKFRKSYLSNQPESDVDAFYYLCTLSAKSIDLNQSCNHFQPELSLLDKSDLAE